MHQKLIPFTASLSRFSLSPSLLRLSELLQKENDDLLGERRSDGIEEEER